MPRAPDAIQSILDMLSAGDVELQCAAARVLGELRPPGEEPVRRLARMLTEGAPLARTYALSALGRIGTAAAVQPVIRALEQPDPVRARAREVLIACGPDAVAQLEPVLKRASPALRLAAIEVLGHIHAKPALDLLLACLDEDDPEAVRAAAAMLRQHVEAMVDKDRADLHKRLARELSAAKPRRPAHAIAALLRLLGMLRQDGGAPVLLRWAGAGQPTNLRANALMALAAVPLAESAHAELATALLPMLTEGDWNNLGAHALTVLMRLTLPAALGKHLERLLDHPLEPVRLFACRALGATGTAAAARRLLTLLDDPAPGTVEEAARALQNPAFRKPVLAAYQAFATPARGWQLVQILKGQGAQLDGPTRQSVSKKLLAALAAGKDESKVHFELLRAADPAQVRELLLEKGRAHRRSGDAEAAVRALGLINRDDLLTPEIQYEVALARLHTLPLDLTRPLEAGSPVHHLANLLRHPDFPLLERMRGERPPIPPAILLFLGFQWTQRAGPERELGGEVLKLLVARHPKSAEARTARTKLKTEVLGE